MPDPTLGFENGDNKQTFNAPLTLDTRSVHDWMEELKIKYPKLPEPPQAASPPRQARRGSVDVHQLMIEASRYPADQPHPADIRKYNDALDSFYRQYDKYLRERDAIDQLRARTIRPKIRLQNNGTAPAELATVFIRIPAHVGLRRNELDFRLPKRPEPPEQPKPRPSALTPFDFLRRSEISPSFLSPRIFQPPLEPPNIEGNKIETKDGIHHVSFRVRQATHNLVYECPYDLFLVFESLEKARSFQIEWEIICANLPHPTKGVLHVIVERGESDLTFEYV